MADWPETPCVQCGTRTWLYARQCPGCKVDIWDHFYKVTSPYGQTYLMPIKGLWRHAAPGGMETLTYLNPASNQHEPVFDGRPIVHGHHVLVHHSKEYEIEAQNFPTPPIVGLSPTDQRRRRKKPKALPPKVKNVIKFIEMLIKYESLNEDYDLDMESERVEINLNTTEMAERCEVARPYFSELINHHESVAPLWQAYERLRCRDRPQDSVGLSPVRKKRRR